MSSSPVPAPTMLRPRFSRRMAFPWLFLLVCMVAIVLVTGRLLGAALLPAGATAPSFSLSADDGRLVSPLSGGRPVLIEFFETGCQVCQREAATVCALRSSHPTATVVGIDAVGEDGATLRRFRHDHLAQCGSSTLPLLVDPGADVTHRYRVSAVPTVYVVDGAGRIAFAATGASGINAAGNALQRLGA